MRHPSPHQRELPRGTASAALVCLLIAACGTHADDAGPAAPSALRQAAAIAPAGDDAPRFSDWSEPVALGPVINSDAIELELTISRDGRSLFFSSNRSGDFDIWVSRRASVDEPWGPPMSIGPAVNTPAREQGPHLSIDGHRLYFYSDREGSAGTDLWVTRRRDQRDDFGWQAPVNLGAVVNSDAGESLPVVFEDDATGILTLYFTSNRGGSPDIWASTLGANGVFAPPQPVSELNSSRRDRVQAIRRDGLELFLGSDRPGPAPAPFDLWVATRRSTSDPWSAPVKLDAPINGPADEGSAALSFDGTTLYFTSSRAGTQDFWVSTRSRLRGPDR